MRTSILIAAVTILAAATFAFAQGGFGPGFGPGYGPGMMWGQGAAGQGGFGPGACFGRGGGFGAGAQTAEQLTLEQATAKVNEYIANYKGYVVESVEAFQMPRGTMYNATVKDAGGNTFYFRVNPWGFVHGPIQGNVQ